MEHNFNEKKTEFFQGKELPVVMTPKYLESKKKAIELIESGLYKGLNDGHFWILMNSTKNGKMAYTGLIISHDGMQIINDNLPDDKRVKAIYFSTPQMSEYKEKCMFMLYQDEDTMELGEVSVDNCKNAYPYAMLFKRTFDRVVRSKAKLYGIYSEAEADEFKQPIDDDIDYVSEVTKLYSVADIKKIIEHYNVNSLAEVDVSILRSYYNSRKK